MPGLACAYRGAGSVATLLAIGSVGEPIAPARSVPTTANLDVATSIHLAIVGSRL
jgi:hypothetical protein